MGILVLTKQMFLLYNKFMQFYDFILTSTQSLTDNVIFFTVSIILTICILCSIFFIFLTIKRDKDNVLSISEESNSIRIIIIDKSVNTVRFFDKSNLRKVKKITMDEFFVQFPTEQLDDLSNWLNKLLEKNSKVSSFFETTVYTMKARRTFSSIIHVTDVNHEKKMIYLESYLFKTNSKLKKGNSNRTSSSRDEITTLLKNASPFKGVTTTFKIIQKTNNKQEDTVSQVHFAALRNIMLEALMISSRYLLDVSNTELTIFDLKVSSRPAEMVFIRKLLNDMKLYLSIQGVANVISIGAGLVENKYFPNDFDKILDESRRVANASIDNNELYLWYEKSMRINLSNDETYHTEVERIIRDKKLKYTFKGIYDIDKTKSIGYFGNVTPFDTFFSSLYELKEYATKIEEDKELLSTITRNVISRFVQAKIDKNSKLFYTTNLDEKTTLMRILSHLSVIDEVRLVLLFNESLLFYDSKTVEEIETLLESFRQKGYEIGLILSDHQIALSPRLYGLFDYFVVKCGLDIAKNTDNNDIIKVRTIVEKLLKYEKPIIADEVETWKNIELLVLSGIKYISSETISQSDEMILPLNPKKIIKLKSIRK